MEQVISVRDCPTCQKRCGIITTKVSWLHACQDWELVEMAFPKFQHFVGPFGETATRLGNGSPVRIVKLLTQNNVRGDFWVITNGTSPC